MSKPSPSTRQEPARPSGSAPSAGGGRDALLVFCGTLAAASLALNLAFSLAPERFGLRPVGSRAVGSDSAPLNGTESGPGQGPRGGGEEGQVPGFAPRVSTEDDELTFSAPRPAVDRAAASPTLAEAIFRDAEPSVVHVTTLATMTGAAAEPFAVSGVGSGLVWDRDGHIVTSKHVVDDIHGATVTLSNGAKYSAKIVGQDAANDLAVIRIDAPMEHLTPIRVGTSSDLKVGMTVFSVACPYGLDPCLTTGHVSGLGRTIRSTTNEELRGVIQTDAALHPGSSGGALVDDQGRVVGLNAAMHSDYLRYGGVGFAVPIDVVAEQVPGIIRSGARWYPRYGFSTVGQTKNKFYLESALRSDGGAGAAGPQTMADVPTVGLVIGAVLKGSLASRAGLRGVQRQVYEGVVVRDVVRDIIVSVGGAARGHHLGPRARGSGPGPIAAASPGDRTP